MAEDRQNLEQLLHVELGELALVRRAPAVAACVGDINLLSLGETCRLESCESETPYRSFELLVEHAGVHRVLPLALRLGPEGRTLSDTITAGTCTHEEPVVRRPDAEQYCARVLLIQALLDERQSKSSGWCVVEVDVIGGYHHHVLVREGQNAVELGNQLVGAISTVGVGNDTPEIGEVVLLAGAWHCLEQIHDHQRKERTDPERERLRLKGNHDCNS